MRAYTMMIFLSLQLHGDGRHLCKENSQKILVYSEGFRLRHNAKERITPEKNTINVDGKFHRG